MLGYFAKGAAANNDWLVDASKNDSLWGGSGTTASAGTCATQGSPAAMKGPCQSGYHVPTQKEWCDAIAAVSPDVTACDDVWHVETTANKFMTTLRLPLAGYRVNSSAAYYYQGTYGFYWASSPTGTFGNDVVLSSTLGVIPATNHTRAFGLSVRCLKN